MRSKRMVQHACAYTRAIFSRGRARVAGKRRLSREAADAEYAAGLFMIPGTPSKLLTLHDKHFPTVCVCMQRYRGYVSCNSKNMPSRGLSRIHG